MEKNILELVEQVLEQQEQEQEIQTLTEKVSEIESSYVPKGVFIFFSIVLSLLISTFVVLCFLESFDERLNKLESSDKFDKLD